MALGDIIATAQTKRWATNAPYVKLTVTQGSWNGGASTYNYTFEYIASSAASASSPRTYRIKIGSLDVTGTFDINGKAGTKTIKSGSVTIQKGVSKKAITVYCSFEFNLTWSGTYAGKIYDSTSFELAAKTQYKITYNANGGTSAPATHTKLYGEDLKLTTATPTREGYTFKGWAITSSSAVAYAPGATYSTNASQTLYAVWEQNTYTITLAAKGGIVSPASITKQKNVDVELPTPTLSGYTFKGWSISSTQNVISYAPGAMYTGNADALLYAVWVADYTKPIISNLTIERCDADGNITDTGTSALVEFAWTTTRSVKEIAISYPNGFITMQSFVTSGNVSRIVGNGAFSLGDSYTITVSITDKTGASTSASGTLLGKVYPIHFKAGGNGAAIGKKSELDDTFEVDYKTVFYKPVEFKGGTEGGGESSFEPSFVRVCRVNDTSNLSTSYNYFGGISGNPVADIQKGNLTYAARTLATFGDRINTETHGVLIGANVHTVRVTGTVCLKNNGSESALMALHVLKVRGNESTIEATGRCRLLATEVLTMTASTIIEVEEGDYICLQGYKGIKGIDITIQGTSNQSTKITQLCVEAIG
jgi:uncharacterized repeat protein (TIGR02543 family)